MGFISVGYGNLINCDRVVAVMTYGSAPSKRIMQEAKDNGLCIDVTQGRRTKSIIVMDSQHVILSSLHSNTLLGRLDGTQKSSDETDLEDFEDQ